MSDSKKVAAVVSMVVEAAAGRFLGEDRFAAQSGNSWQKWKIKCGWCSNLLPNIVETNACRISR